MPAPSKLINVVTLAKSVLGSQLTIHEGRGLVQEKLKQLCQGQLAVIDSVESSLVTSVYFSTEEKNYLYNLWKYGCAETMNYNMEIMSARMSRSETAISCIQTKVSKQVMPLSFIRLYTISSRAKGGYYKLPHDLLNSIKSMLCIASAFNDARTRALFPSVTATVEQALTQL
ncbi:hypothetical protein PMAYCL1PPCAC_10402, partial [Pristionchus mayeri]